MGVLRGRIDRELRAADREQRYRLLCPRLDWLDPGKGCLNVHSKVLVVDDAFVTIGSANLSNRSMGLDTECNLALESNGDPRLAEAIAGLRARLLAEHLGTTAQTVDAAIATHGSLLRAIDALRNPNGRTLEPVVAPLDATLDALVPDHTVLDPERPTDADALVNDLVRSPDVREGARRRVAVFAGVVLVAAGLAVAWHFSPVREVLSLKQLAAFGDALRGHPLAPLAIVAAFVLAGFLFVPVTLLIGACALVFGPIAGSLYAFVGAIASAAATYGAGRLLGRDAVRRLAGSALNRISQRLGRRGLIAVTLVRLVPLAPFTVVNAVAGASHIGWRDFLAGTALGLLPGLVVTAAFVDRALAAARHPGPGTFALLAAVAAVAVASVRWIHRRLAPPRDPGPADGEHAG
jgi:uncharacterized membrane protein YdjX (TVP38/TMEM64 family)